MINQIRECKFLVKVLSISAFLLLNLLLGTNTTVASPVPGDVGFNIQQQDVPIIGQVVDEENIPLPGVSILIKGTNSGTITDADGNYSLNVPVGTTLQISFIGFATQEIVVAQDQTVYNIVLLEEAESLEEVVVIGYGVQKKVTVTGSLSTISSDEISQQPVTSISQALAGRLPGLIANSAGGRPGQDAATIKIRGIGTLDAGAGSNPLIMIDGIERDQNALNFLDPMEIESLSILKDASSTAVFGVRGANGVIIVTTKRGKVGPAKISYNANQAIMIPDRSIKLVDSYQQTGLLNEFQGFAANTTDPTAPYPQDIRDRFKGVIDGNPIEESDPFFYPSTDYAELMLKDYALQQKHNFTIRGGTERVKYFASLGYFNQGGMFENLNSEIDKSTSYSRYNFRTNMDVKLTNTTTAKINIGGSFNESISLGQNGTEPSRSFYWNLGVHASPWDGYMHEDKLVMLQENANSVLLNSDMRGYNVQLQNTSDYTFKIDQKLDFITPGLSAKATASFASYFSNNISRAKSEKRLPYWSPFLNPDGTVSFYQEKEDILPYNSVGQGKNRKEYYELALNYNRTFNKDHTVSLLGLFNAEKSHFTQSQWNSIPRAYLGVVGRASYNYRNRYIVEFNLGYNGSENFAEGQRFGLFPAWSAGWSFTEEPWLQNLIGDKVLSYGKLRFSYGTVGNDRMRVNGQDIRYLYLPDSYSISNYNYHGWHDIGVNFGLPGATTNNPLALPGTAGNPNVTWEKATKVNYGADLSFFQSLLSVKFDYFTESRTDILINQNVVPVYQQTGALALNLGQVENKGYEFEIGLRKDINTDIQVWTSLNYTHSQNKIIEMDEPEQPFEYREQTGRRVGEIWGYMQDDFFRTTEEADDYIEELWTVYQEQNPDAIRADYQAYQIFNAGSDVSAGDLKYIDRNEDGLINDMDEGYLGVPNFPETMFGFKSGINYKNFSFSFMLQGAADFAINVRTDNSPALSKGTAFDFVLNRYTPERYENGEEIEFPRLLSTNNNWQDVGSFWMQDARYLRLKNVELAYTFDSNSSFLRNIGIDNIRLYTNGLNLLTFSTIKYLDPETTNGVLRYPRSRVVNLGVQVQF